MKYSGNLSSEYVNNMAIRNGAKFIKPTTRKQYVIQAGKYRLDLGCKTQIMGVVNITPDSFSRDGCLADNSEGIRKAVRMAKQFVRDGADIIDIGGESSRPGAKRITVKEELDRVIPVLKALVQKFDVPISVDTYKPAVVKEALEAGASIINNIMGVDPDRRILKMVRNYKCAIALMHIQGTPRTMQKRVYYQNIISEIIDALRCSVKTCLDVGISRDQIIIDPGIGFGKTVEHNLEILNCLREFNILKQPILVGPSRKSFIGKVLNREVDQRLIGTVATVCASIINGVHIVRVHDVKQIKESAGMTDAIMNSGKK